MDEYQVEDGDWEVEESNEETEDLTFPIGYTIDFSSGYQDLQEDEGSSAPRHGLGSQVLPVSSNLRSDWDGIPVDGAEYLFTVRQEAKSRPRIVAKENPYTLPQPCFDLSLVTRLACKAPQGSPSSSWRSSFIDRFTNMRKSISRQEPWDWDLAEDYRRPPPDNDESNWKIFILGRKSNLKDYPPRAPIPLFLKALNQLTVIAVLSHYQTWIQENIDLLAKTIETSSKIDDDQVLEDSGDHSPSEDVTLLSPFDGAWLIGLLSVLDTVLTAEDIFKLRELARKCKQVIKITNAALELGYDHSVDQEAGVAWMVIAAVADIWGQKDLWKD